MMISTKFCHIDHYRDAVSIEALEDFVAQEMRNQCRGSLFTPLGKFLVSLLLAGPSDFRMRNQGSESIDSPGKLERLDRQGRPCEVRVGPGGAAGCWLATGRVAPTHLPLKRQTTLCEYHKLTKRIIFPQLQKKCLSGRQACRRTGQEVEEKMGQRVGLGLSVASRQSQGAFPVARGVPSRKGCPQ